MQLITSIVAAIASAALTGILFAQQPHKQAAVTSSAITTDTSIAISKDLLVEAQLLDAQFHQLEQLQQILSLRKENLRLRICGEAEIKPDVCAVDWNKATVTRQDRPVTPTAH